MITREQLLGLTARRYDTVHVGGFEFRIRNLSEDEKSEFEASVLNSKGDYSLAKVKRQRRRLIVLCLVDDAGDQLLRPGDELHLGPIDGAVTHQLYDACRKHCGFEEGDLEELVKNSVGSRGGDSLSD